MSRQHCELLVENEEIRLRDLGSSNGTYHNHMRIQETTVAAGDEIVIGPVVFTVVVNGQPETIRPVRTMVNSASSPSSGDVLSSVGMAEDDDEDMLANFVEEEGHSPTVDLDDPIAALDALAEETETDGSHVNLLDDEDTKKG